MNISLILSLAIPAVISLIGVFYEKKTLTVKLVLCTFILGGLIFTYIDTHNNDTENKKYRKAEIESQEILKTANGRIAQQAVVINSGFENLNSQLSSAGINNSSLLSSMKNLETQVIRLATDSRSYFSKALAVKVTTDEKPDPVVDIDTNTFRIPFGSVNSVSIDNMNQFAVSNEQPNERGRIRIVINGIGKEMAPGEQVVFYNKLKRRAYLVYKGKENENLVFYTK